MYAFWPKLLGRILASITLLILVVAAGFLIWSVLLKDRFIPKRWGMVEEGLIYRSGRLSPRLLETVLRRHHIRQIVDLTFPEPASSTQQMERKIAAEHGVLYMNYPLYGSGVGEVEHYANALAAVVTAKKAQQAVLIHCSAGTQRTGGIVAAYRVLIEKEPPSEAYAELLRYGWNPQNDQILLEFLNSRMDELAHQLVALGLLDTVPDPLPIIGP